MPVEQRKVLDRDAGMRLDRWFRQHFPALPFGRLQKLLRTGQVRVDGARVTAGMRLQTGQVIRVPPLPLEPSALPQRAAGRSPSAADRDFIRGLVFYEDARVLALNKPPGLAVQGGRGIARHVDGLLTGLVAPGGERPRLVHRLDKDTSGVLLLARNRQVAADLGELFRGRGVEKVYWALVRGVPRQREGEIKSRLRKARDGRQLEKVMVQGEAGRGEDAGKVAVTRYRVVAVAGTRFAWLEMRPLTGRTHQLRVHAAAMGHPIIGDGKYGGARAHPAGGEISARLHLHARALILRPGGAFADGLRLVAELPEHMARSWALLGFSTADAVS